MILSWKMIVISILAMIGAIALALLLIPPLSLNAAIRGGTITISMFLAQQIGFRLARKKKPRD
jgi:hypothetical protein